MVLVVPNVPNQVAFFANDAADIDDSEQPLVKPSRGHRHSHILTKRHIVAVRVRAKRKVKQALKLYEGRGLSGLAQFCMGKVEEMCEIRGMGEEEATLETMKTRDKTLVAQEELKKRAVRVRIVVFDELVEPAGLRVSVQQSTGKQTRR